LDDQPAAAADAALQRRLESELAGALRDPVTPAPTVAVLHAASAAAGIIGYARSHAVDVIVLGTHGHSGLEDFFLGSVAQKLVRSAPCPVVTVRACPPDLS
jgi:nucleotide-binding universal stress UspA family protein